MKTYISDLSVNDDVTSFFLISDAPQVRESKKGSEYLCLKLIDKTGEVDARVWDIPPELVIKTLKQVIVKVKAKVGEWNDQKQLSVSQIRLVTEEDGIDLGDFFERSERDPEEMWDELIDLTLSSSSHDPGISNPHLNQLVYDILSQNKENFCKAPAAKSHHHAYIGGLLEHVLSMCHTTFPLSYRYKLDRSLMLTACILHDIGKIWELTYSMGTAYSVEGTLLGHITIGIELTSRAADKLQGFPQPLKIAVLHLIASHHGLLEWGSPKVPLMREAIAFHYIDMIDSRLAMCDKALKDGVNDDGLSAWSREFGGQLFLMKESDDGEPKPEDSV